MHAGQADEFQSFQSNVSAVQEICADPLDVGSDEVAVVISQDDMHPEPRAESCDEPLDDRQSRARIAAVLDHVTGDKHQVGSRHVGQLGERQRVGRSRIGSGGGFAARIGNRG